MSDVWNPGVVYLRIQPKKERSFVSRHTCWNTDIFVECQRAAHAKEGGKVEVIDAETYEREHKK
jgi:hypothetical protein